MKIYVDIENQIVVQTALAVSVDLLYEGNWTDVTSVSPLPELNWTYNSGNNTFSPPAEAQYNVYSTYLEFVTYMATFEATLFSTMIREKNKDSLLGSQLEVYFEVIKAADGINFNNPISRINFALLKSPIAGVGGNVTILTNAQYDAIVNIED